jgi:hypothetical protein
MFNDAIGEARPVDPLIALTSNFAILHFFDRAAPPYSRP